MKLVRTLWIIVLAAGFSWLACPADAFQHEGLIAHAELEGASAVSLASGMILTEAESAETQSALLVRKPISQLTAAEVESLRHGIEVMKSRPLSDRTSWWYWANIHGTPGFASDPLWNKCEHRSMHFLTWHRAYLYFFEKVLRDAAGDPNLTLPYWKWETYRSLPLVYRSPANASNSLYDGSRQMNNGAMLPTSVVVTGLNAALRRNSFSRFSSSLERSPHDPIHGLVGGNMSSVPTAARDPIFWSHHANVDRQWSRWLNSSSSHQNPTNSSFLNRQFTFVDVNGNDVSIRAGDVLDHHALGYRYLDDPEPTPEPLGLAAEQESKLLKFAPEVVKVDFSQAMRAVDGGVASQQRLMVDVVGIQIVQAPSFVYGIYLNLPDGEVSEEQLDLHYVGAISFFGRGGEDHAHAGGDAGGGFTHSADTTQTLRRLRAAGMEMGAEGTVTLRPISLVPPPGQGAAVRATNIQSAAAAQVTYREIRVRLADQQDEID